MLDVIADFWKPVKKIQPQQKLREEQIQTGSSIGFGFVPQALLSGRRLVISAINTYQFGIETLTSYVLSQDKEPSVSMIVADADGEQYLAISRRIPLEERNRLFDSMDLESCMTNPDMTRLACKDNVADFKTWLVSSYKREIHGLRGRIYKGDYRKLPLPATTEGQDFTYTLLVSDSNEHALEIEKYQDGRLEVYATIYRRVTDIGEIVHPINELSSRPEIKLATKRDNVVPPVPANDVPAPVQIVKPSEDASAEMSAQVVEPETEAKAEIATEAGAQTQPETKVQVAPETKPQATSGIVVKGAEFLVPSTSLSTDQGKAKAEKAKEEAIASAVAAALEKAQEDIEEENTAKEAAASPGQPAAAVASAKLQEPEVVAEAAAEEAALSDTPTAEPVEALTAGVEIAEAGTVEPVQLPAIPEEAVEEVAAEQLAQAQPQEETSLEDSSETINEVDTENASQAIQTANMDKENTTMPTTETVAVNGTNHDVAKPTLYVHSTAQEAAVHNVKAVQRQPGQFENDSVECDLRVANRIIDEAIRNEMRLTDIVRRIIELPVAYPEAVQIPVTLTDEDYSLLAIRYGIPANDRNAIKRRIIEDLNSFAGDRK